jgi:uncharacterized membrane protein YkvA (DUF1232 family)
MRFDESERDPQSEAARVVPNESRQDNEQGTQSQTPAMDKVLLGAAVFYVVGPIDLIPDSIPILGQLDDLYLLAICLLRLLNRSGPEKIRAYWNGPQDIVALLQEVTDLSTRFLPEQVRGTIQNWVRARSK